MQESKAGKMAPRSCLRQRLFTDVTSGTERHFPFLAVGRGIEVL